MYPLRWILWIVEAVFTAVAARVERKLLPPDHPGRRFVYAFATAAARLATTWLLRWLGISQEAHFVETWANQSRGEVAPTNAVHELRQSRRRVWTSALPLASVAVALVRIYLLAPDIARMLAPPLLIVGSVFSGLMWFYLSRPIVRVDGRGIRGLLHRPIAWRDVAACRFDEKHTAWGDAARHRIEVLGQGDKVLRKYDIITASKADRERFCAQLRHVLRGSGG